MECEAGVDERERPVRAFSELSRAGELSRNGVIRQ